MTTMTDDLARTETTGPWTCSHCGATGEGRERHCRPRPDVGDLRERGVVVAVQDVALHPGAEEPSGTAVTVEMFPTGAFREGQTVYLATLPAPVVSGEAVEAHYPAGVGSIMGADYTGPYVVCACQANRWGEGPRIPAAEYPTHLLAALGITVADAPEAGERA